MQVRLKGRRKEAGKERRWVRLGRYTKVVVDSDHLNPWWEETINTQAGQDSVL